MAREANTQGVFTVVTDDQSTLQALLRKAASDRDLSGRALADLANSNGWKLTHGTINAIRNGSYKSDPSEDTIRAIAWLAGVSERVAFAAAGRRQPGPPFADELPPGVDDLSPKERKAAIEMLRVLVAQRQEIIAADFGSAGQLQADVEVVESPQRPVRRRRQPGPPVHPVNRDVEREQPTFDRSRMLAAMEEPEAAEPPDEPDVDAPSDDFEGR